MENQLIEAPAQQLPVQHEAANLLQVISRAAADPAVDIDKLERLMQMSQQITARNALIDYNKAMSAVQQEIGIIAADANNPQTRSKYASYAKLDSVLRPIYTKHGFALSFDEAESPKPEHIRVLCHVSHIAGHVQTFHKDMPVDGKGAKGGDVMTKTHAAGSGMSYGMRYLLKGIFNVAVGENDDDGNAAGKPPVETISDKQVADLKALISEWKIDANAVLSYYEIRSFAEIPVQHYKTVCDMVKERGQRKANAARAK